MDRLERYPVSFRVKTGRIDDHIGACDCRGGASLVEQVSGLVTQFRLGFAEQLFGAFGMARATTRTASPFVRSCATMLRPRNPVPPKTATVGGALIAAPLSLLSRAPAFLSCVPAW